MQSLFAGESTPPTKTDEDQAYLVMTKEDYHICYWTYGSETDVEPWFWTEHGWAIDGFLQYWKLPPIKK